MKTIAKKALIGLFWIGVWQAASMLVGMPKLIPGPGETLGALVRLAGTSAFWASVGMTLTRVAEGYLLAVAAGVLLATGCHAVVFHTCQLEKHTFPEWHVHLLGKFPIG